MTRVPRPRSLGAAAVAEMEAGKELAEMVTMLSESERAIRLVTDNIDEVFWIVDATGTRNLYISASYDRVWGRPREELKADAAAFDRAIHPDDRDRVLAEMEAAHGSRSRLHYRIIRPDGTIRWIEARSFPVADAADRVTQIVVVAEDITDRKLHELRERIGRGLQAALEGAETLQGYLDKATELFTTLLGWEIGQAWVAEGAVLRRASAWDAGLLALAAFSDASRTLLLGKGEGLAGAVWRDGRGIWLSDVTGSVELVRVAEARAAGLQAAAAVPIQVTGQALGALVFFSRRPSPADPDLLRLVEDAGHLVGQGLVHLRTRDALRTAEEQIRQVQKLESLGQLAGVVAHDFNNLLTPILGYSELLLEEPGLAEPVRHHLGSIRFAANEAAALTRQLLTFARKQPVVPKPVNLNTVIHEMRDMLGRVGGKGMRLDVRLDPGLAEVLVDRNQMSQVLVNLVANARDAMPGGGAVIVNTRDLALEAGLAGAVEPIPAGRYALLEVADRGTGMDAATRARIFEPFFTTKGDGKGTGLGLATVFGVVKAGGGFLDVDSAPGAGATFRIFLPVLSGAGGGGA